MKKSTRLSLTVLCGLLAAAWLSIGHAFADSSADATITVTPAAEVSLTLDTTSYAFGAIDVNTSTNTATALRLNNVGDVTVAVDKQITVESDPGGWTASTSSGTDTYVLYCATSTTRLWLSDFTASTMFGVQGNVSPLTGQTGISPLMPSFGAGSSVDLWFRLDMPTKVTSSASRMITVRFTGTAQ